MPRIDLAEPYAIRFARQSIKDALMMHGEECILMHMYHVNDVPKDQPRCAACYDDIYKQGDSSRCTRCYGTTYDGGVKEFWRSWAIFTDTQDQEDMNRQGVWHPRPRSIHTEWKPDLWQRDYVIRVARWTPDHRPVEIEGIYTFKEVNNESLRTGNVFGQTDFDAISQRGEVDRVSEQLPIYKFPALGRVIPRYDGRVR
ncbi:hypothetical protein MYRNA_119 [Mycobacterium phage Myrna]|uniref:Uncharacterized protein n=1 Tax=Mycobacterium phage Myrna TaxID=546805 RepID=B5LJC3_9CAUD|nr:118 [Mycobacterium phage Myrna]ACH62120.1 hypothetical protein MYRNA_119 [Mycobacterium phage Myrna]